MGEPQAVEEWFRKAWAQAGARNASPRLRAQPASGWSSLSDMGLRKLSILSLLALAAAGAERTAAIKVDQAGYLPDAPKVAMVAAAAPAREFTVRQAGSGKAVFTGTLGEPLQDADSGDRVQTADFTKLARPGRYYLEVAGMGRSWEFSIGKDVYSRAFYLAVRSYYGQRCGTIVNLGSEFPGFQHEACHLEGAYHASSGKSGQAPSKMGWHDAGDYGRYVVNSGITTGTLLWTYEMFRPQVEKVRLNIPESSNGTPDILDEIRWNLEWMLTMQDADGGVWHKQTTEKFSGFIMPEADTMPGVVIGTGREPFKSSCATADFAAVMAAAGRVYKPFDAAFARQALGAAESAWKWLEQNPNVLFSNPAGVSTGAYGDRNCSDERLWAAAELYRTTGGAQYRSAFEQALPPLKETIRAENPQSWANVAPLGIWAYVMAGGAGSGDLKTAILKAADQVVERSAKNGYRTGMTARDYVWGSNGVVGNYAMQLLVANALKPDARYVHAALDHLHYLLGRNTHSLSFLTQVGENACKHPHHRPSGADANEAPWPGLLAGGPNGRKQDPAMSKLPDGMPPAKMYLDEQASYATNEVAINWNAPLVFVLAAALP